MRYLFLPLAVALTLAGESPLQILERNRAEDEAARRAHWGLLIVDLKSRTTLARHNADLLFTPASNMKLFSSAAVLHQLGPDFRFRTTVWAPGPPNINGVLHGDLVLKGSGDPNLSGRPLPYDPKAERGEPLQPLGQLALQLAARGLKRVTGDIIGDDSAFEWEPYPPGWAIDDQPWSYGAPVSALVVHDNTIELSVSPGDAVGDPVALSLRPSLEYLTIHNTARTVTSDQSAELDVRRLGAGGEIWLTGQLPMNSEPRKFNLAVDDPARWAAAAFIHELRRAGVRVDGQPRARHRYPGDPPFPAQPCCLLGSISSVPLSQLIQVANKESQNLHTEVLVRAAASDAGFATTAAGAVQFLRAFAWLLGIPDTEFHFEDASGLSRKALVTPSSVIRLLEWMVQSPAAQPWLDSLPIAGVDGTLEQRMKTQTSADRIRAKTGTISHVAALSGYVLRRPEPPILFSVFVNHYMGPPAGARTIIDKIVMSLLEDR
jgi:D-alanyl-D-alanine carboxypeptidase/D-alanyl-D-alanine-endopeptidase (penicillin-binding protein 4)